MLNFSDLNVSIQSIELIPDRIAKGNLRSRGIGRSNMPCHGVWTADNPRPLLCRTLNGQKEVFIIPPFDT